jgi:large subunit ribosomal protein L25
MDFFRVSKTTKLQTRAPLHFINEETCVGVKMGGGLIARSMTDIEISCLPKDLPEYIEVDMAEVDLGQTVHLSDIKLPKGVESVALSHGDDHDLPVAAVNKPKAVEEISDEAPESPDAPETDSDADSAEEASEE